MKLQLISRAQAKAEGRVRYFTGLQCAQGHVAERLTSNGGCLVCAREKVARKRAGEKQSRPPKPQSARAIAMDEGRVRYFTGLSCPAGHVAERFTSSGRCCTCADDAQKDLLANRPERHRARTRTWSLANPEKTRAMKRPANANRRANQLQRMPAWLSDEDKRRIKVKHAEARWMTAHTGIAHAVDHIYPLQGDSVSGLHVPWNLRVIPARENSRKSNKMPR